MVTTKSPKALVRRRRRFKNANPIVNLQKLDENLFKKYRDRLGETFCNTASSIKEERSCFFNSEIVLNDNEQLSYFAEQNVPCVCGYCSPLYEMKRQSQQELLDNFENQENEESRENVAASPYQYLRDNRQPYAYQPELLRSPPPLPQNVPVPAAAAAVTKCDASTQTDARQFRFTCEECQSKFNNQYFYERHLLVHRKQYECPFCDACFGNEKQLQPHVLLHMSKNHFECTYCSCVFADKRHLIRHIASHDRTFFECGECKAKFATDKGLQAHRRSHVSTGKMVHVFRLPKGAGRTPGEDEPAQAHAERRSQQRPAAAAPSVTVQTIVRMDFGDMAAAPEPASATHFYGCDACPLHFSNEKSLRRHSVIHRRRAGNFLHFCTVCSARFRANNHLQCHLRNAHKRFD